MDIRIGGRLGPEPQFGEVVVKKVPHWELNETLLRIFTLYEQHHTPGEDFREFAGRTDARVVDERAGARRGAGLSSVADVLAQAVERHHPRLVMLCSFQKEESVLVDELVRIAPDARIVTIDTGVLFPETLATWRAFEERFGVDIAIEDATGRWTGAAHCCGDAKVAALERALAGADAWITGIRREQSPTRAAAQSVEFDDRRGIWKYNPLVAWTEKDLWKRIHERDLPYHPLHDQGYCLDRLRPVHGARRRPRRPLGWAVEDRVRASRP